MRCYFIDVDDTLLSQGIPIPEAAKRCNELFDAGHQVWLFTCWPPTQQSAIRLRSLGIKFHGMIGKPLADQYIYIDDKLDVLACSTSMSNVK